MAVLVGRRDLLEPAGEVLARLLVVAVQWPSSAMARRNSSYAELDHPRRPTRPPDTSDTSDTPTHQGSREPVTLARARCVSHDTRSCTITKLASPGPGR